MADSDFHTVARRIRTTLIPLARERLKDEGRAVALALVFEAVDNMLRLWPEERKS
jgi:hypothetical protein